MFFYGGPRNKQLYGFIPYDEQDAGGIYIKHYRQYLILDYLSKKCETLQERAQARAEMTHCEEVLARWKLHPNWIEEAVLPIIEQMKKKSIQELVTDYGRFG